MPSAEAAALAVQHELQEALSKALALRQELYGWQELVHQLEDEIDFLWNRNTPGE